MSNEPANYEPVFGVSTRVISPGIMSLANGQGNRPVTGVGFGLRVEPSFTSSREPKELHFDNLFGMFNPTGEPSCFFFDAGPGEEIIEGLKEAGYRLCGRFVVWGIQHAIGNALRDTPSAYNVILK